MKRFLKKMIIAYDFNILLTTLCSKKNMIKMPR